ncbi:hypothetical protein JVT61DRAFT_10600 [Boletus reticuloceps]|uniref:Uncharacterized protein n=1 Tax=Boletus reticuloceps TaxID=495285 RepID=A0A8I3A493_9AGAM|nr:hypothetical protein JVT61DRAFT_10600 [Boletus reticuloceps]
MSESRWRESHLLANPSTAAYDDTYYYQHDQYTETPSHRFVPYPPINQYVENPSHQSALHPQMYRQSSNPQLQMGLDVFNGIWPQISNLNDSTLMAAIQPVRQSIGSVNRSHDPESHIIADSGTVDPPPCNQRETRAKLPRTPGICSAVRPVRSTSAGSAVPVPAAPVQVPTSIPAPAADPVVMPGILTTASATSSGDVPVPFNNDTSAGPLPIPVKLDREEKKKAIAEARVEAVRQMFLGTAVPNRTECKDLVRLAAAHGVESVVGGVFANPPTNAEREVRLAMTDARRRFKAYGLCHASRDLGLRVAHTVTDTQIPYCAGRVRQLLSGCEFLRDNHTDAYFSSPFFEHFVIDMLTYTPYELCSFIRVEHMDNFFGFVGAAIIATLHDFVEGHYLPRDLDGGCWRVYYLEIMHLIEGIRSSADDSQWLQNWQQQLLQRSCACLLAH